MENILNTFAGRTNENPTKTSNDETEEIDIKDTIKNFTEKVSEALKEKDEEIKRLTGILEQLGKTFNSIVTEDPVDGPIDESIGEDEKITDEMAADEMAADEPVPQEEGEKIAAENDSDKEKKGGYRYKVKRNSSLRKKKKSSIARSPNSLKKMN